MDGTSKRWNQVTPSQFAWEAEAQEILRAMLPDQDPYRGWTNFEFTNGGAIAEVDSLVITPKGVF
ncbi:MAG: NERD domain-containing protein, partial [Candidatus Microthrix parvicella]|nr:NERD domain-containing protein [Candidatus Microthrix parvicella]